MKEIMFYEFSNPDNKCFQALNIPEEELEPLREVQEDLFNRDSWCFVELYPVKCAWCGKTLYHAEIEHSDGICKECSINLLIADY